MKCLNEKVIFRTKLFTIKDINLLSDSRKKVTYHILEKGGWSDLVCTQLKEFKPIYVIPDYSAKYTQI